MSDSPETMLGHVALRLRLVYESSEPVSGKFARSDVPGWELVGILPEDAPDGILAESGRHVTAPMVLTLDRDEAEGYYLNLTSPQPSLFALLRVSDVASATASQASAAAPEAVAITASYSEAARWMDGGMVVVRASLPDPLPAWIAEFAQYHFQVEGRKKRGKYRPSFLSRQEFGEEAKAALHELDRAPKVTRH